jgi:DNA-binding GntR family transcriptional regulator
MTPPPSDVRASRTRSALPRTAEAIAASEVRAAIVRGDLEPGAKILQEATARELGVSLIPLREALKTLASEGVVTYEPQRGYFVTELPSERVGELYELRELLEAETERRAVERVDEHAIELMRSMIRAEVRAIEERDAVEMIAANRTFHFAVFESCENAWLVRFVTQVWDALDPYRVLSYRRMWLEADQELVPEQIVSEHERIVSALARGKGERALELLRRHRSRSHEFIVALTPASDAGGA